MHKVLIIDSDPAYCHQVSEMLSILGIEVESAHTRSQGEIMAESAPPPSLIVLSADLDGKKNGGFIVCKKLRGNKDTESIPILLTAADPKDANIVKHQKLSSRADSYLARSDHNTILREINKLLNLDLNVAQSTENDSNPNMDPSLDHLDPFADPADDPRDKEIRELKDKLESLDQHNSYLKKEVDAFKDGTKMLQKEMDQLKARTEQEKEALQARVAELEGLEDSTPDLKARIQQLEQAGNRHETELSDERKETETLRDELMAMKHDHEALQRKQDDASREAGAAKDEIEDLQRRNQELQQKLDRAGNEASARKDELDQALSDKLEIEMEIDGLRNDLDQLKKDAQEKEGVAAGQVETLNAKIGKLEGDLATSREHVQDRERLVEAERKRVADFERDMAENKLAREKSEKQLTEAGDKIRLLEESVQRISQDRDDMQLKLSESEAKATGFDKLLSEKLVQLEKAKKVQDELEKDLDASLAEKKQLEQTFSLGSDNLKKKHEEDLATHKNEWDRERARLNSRVSLLSAEKDTLIKGFAQEKLEHRDKFEKQTRELTEKLDTANQGYHEQKEMVFSLNKKLKSLEESHQGELTSVRESHKTELSRKDLEREEELGRLRTEHQKQQDDQNKRIVSLEQSNAGYVSQTAALEKKLADEETAHAASKDAAGARATELEDKITGLEAERNRDRDRAQELDDQLQEANTALDAKSKEAEQRLEELRKSHEEAFDIANNRVTELTRQLDEQNEELASLRQMKETYDRLRLEHNRQNDAHQALKQKQDRLRSLADNLVKELAEEEGEELELELEES